MNAILCEFVGIGLHSVTFDRISLSRLLITCKIFVILCRHVTIVYLVIQNTGMRDN